MKSIHSTLAKALLVIASLTRLASADDQNPPNKPKGPSVEIEACYLQMSAAVAEKFGLSPDSGEMPGAEPAVLSKGDWSKMLETLASKTKSTDILAAPRVTTRSGQRAVIEIIREFRYPTTFVAADEHPDHLVGSGEFETRNTGVTLEAQPEVRDDGSVSLNIVPSVTTFDGFLTYDAGHTAAENTIQKSHGWTEHPPIGSSYSYDANHTATESVKQKSRDWFQTPLFSTIRTPATLSLKSGQTVLLGGFPWVNDVSVGELMRSMDGKHPPIKPIGESVLLFVAVSATVLEELPEAAARTPMPEGHKVEVATQIISITRSDLVKTGFFSANNFPPAGIPGENPAQKLFRNTSEALAPGPAAAALAAVFSAEALLKFKDSVAKSASRNRVFTGPDGMVAKDEAFDVKAKDFVLIDAGRHPTTSPIELSLKASQTTDNIIDLDISPRWKEPIPKGVFRQQLPMTSVSLYHNQTVVMLLPDPTEKQNLLLVLITVRGVADK